jgi:hypothetical protein
MPIIDQFSDPAYGTLFRQVAKMPALESFVKHASIDIEEEKSLPDTAFAWPAERKYPVHTATHAAMSYAYSKTASSIPEQVTTNIKQALAVYEIPDTVFAETEEKVAADCAEDYLIPSLKLFLVKTAAQCERAQDRLCGAIPRLDLESRATACANLVKKADEFNVTLRPEVMQLAGLVVSSTKFAREWLEARATKLPDSDNTHKIAYMTLADGLRGHPAEVSDRKGLLKLAGVIADLDAKTGLDKHYDRKLPDALRTVFNTEKTAGKSVDLNGTFISVAKLAQLPASFWEDLGGKELSNEIAPGGVVDSSKLATVVETLPLDLKIQLKAHCR